MTDVAPGETTTLAVVFRADSDTAEPLGPGVKLGPGDRIATQRARVQLRRGTDEYMNVHEGSELELTESRTVLQHMGEVYYQVRAAFTVEYGTVEAVVEGTRFLVAGTELDGGPVTVSVDEGTVRVTNSEGSQVVDRGQTLGVPSGGPLPSPERWQPAARGRALQQTVGLGQPRLITGLLLSGAYTGAASQTLTGVGAAQLRPLASWKLVGPVRLVVEPGAGVGARTRQLPVNVGAELQLGPLTAGGTVSSTFEARTADCGAEQQLLHVGGGAHVRAQLPVGRHLRVLGQARVGVSSVVQAELGAGIGWAL